LSGCVSKVVHTDAQSVFRALYSAHNTQSGFWKLRDLAFCSCHFCKAPYPLSLALSWCFVCYVSVVCCVRVASSRGLQLSYFLHFFDCFHCVQEQGSLSADITKKIAARICKGGNFLKFICNAPKHFVFFFSFSSSHGCKLVMSMSLTSFLARLPPGFFILLSSSLSLS
jgi:hypothetical protein